MNFLKIDDERLNKYVDVFHEQSGKYPYLICNKKTCELIEKSPSKKCSYVYSGMISVGKNEEISIGTSNIGETKYYKGCKIIIDNDLELGEIRIG